MRDNKKKNIVAYVFSGLTAPLGFLSLFFLTEAQLLLNTDAPEASSFGEALGGALGTAFAFVILLIFTFLFGIAAYVFGIVSISILGTCIKETERKRKIANIVIISVVGAILLAILIGIILVLFVLNKSSQ